jgi:two-component system, NtrC family, response regulator GlrR
MECAERRASVISEVVTERTIRAKVLLVDDDRYLVDSLAEQLEARCFAVLKAYSTQQGIIELAKDLFDAVIVDWLMPDGEGSLVIEFARQYYPEMRIIVYSAHEDADARSVVAKADGFVQKGADDARLFNALDRAINTIKSTRPVSSQSMGLSVMRSQWLAPCLRPALNIPAHLPDRVGFLSSGFWDADGLATAVLAMDDEAHQSAGIVINCRDFMTGELENLLYGNVTFGARGVPALKRGLMEQMGYGRLVLRNADVLSIEHQAALAQCFYKGSIRRLGSDRDIPINANIAVIVDDAGGKASLDTRLSPVLGQMIEPNWFNPGEAWDSNRVCDLVAQIIVAIGCQRAWLGPAAKWMLTHFGKRLHLSDIIEGVEGMLRRGLPSGMIEFDDLSLPHCSSLFREGQTDNIASMEQATQDIESLYIAKILSATGGNLTKAASLANLGRPAMYARLHKYDMDPYLFKQAKDAENPV